MTISRRVLCALSLAAPFALAAAPASAEDTLKLVMGQINNWENQAPTLGQDAGIFKKHGLVVESTGSQGTGDLFWYVKADSPLKTLKDTTEANTIAYSTNGSSSNNIVVAFREELGAKAKPTATGGPAATLTAVMSGQIDIGWAAPPFGLQEIKEGKIRILARGSDVPSLRGQTVRVLIVNSDSLKNKRDAIIRFMDAY